MSNFISIGCYFLCNLEVYILCIILNYKNLQFKKFIDNIAIDLYSSRNLASMKDIRERCNPMVDLSKFTCNKKILNKIIILDYN